MSAPSKLHLFIAPGCAYCSTMIQTLTELVKQAELAEVTISNIAADPDNPDFKGIRSVPALKYGNAWNTGAMTAEQIKQWLNKSEQDAQIETINESFEQGQLDDIIADIALERINMSLLLKMLCDLQTPLTSRIGISAVFEHYEGNERLQALLPLICDQAKNEHDSIRVDIAYLLGLTQSQSAIACLEKLLDDEFDDVKEAAKESLENLNNSF